MAMGYTECPPRMTYSGVANVAGSATPRDPRPLEQIASRAGALLERAQNLAVNLHETRRRLLGEADPQSDAEQRAGSQVSPVLPEIPELAKTLEMISVVLTNAERHAESLQRM